MIRVGKMVLYPGLDSQTIRNVEQHVVINTMVLASNIFKDLFFPDIMPRTWGFVRLSVLIKSVAISVGYYLFLAKVYLGPNEVQ